MCIFLTRSPCRLPGLFSGYHARADTVWEAVRRCGVEEADFAGVVGRWTAADVHLLVAHFLRIRFPTLLALNKFDVRGASDHVAAARRRYPNEAIATMSARAEWVLARNASRLVGYAPGCAGVTVVAGVAAEAVAGKMGSGSDDAAEAASLTAAVAVVAENGGTGVAAAMTAAVALQPPVVSPLSPADGAAIVGASTFDGALGLLLTLSSCPLCLPHRHSLCIHRLSSTPCPTSSRSSGSLSRGERPVFSGPRCSCTPDRRSRTCTTR